MVEKNVTFKNLKALNDVFKRLNALRRWTSFLTEDKFNELAKQGLNCVTCYFLASYCEQAGMKIHWERFPKIALYRAFQKAYVNFDTPEITINEICKVGNISQSTFASTTQRFIEEKTNQEFTDFICDSEGTFEMEIYKAARRIATLVELIGIKYIAQGTDEYTGLMLEIQESLDNYKNIPGVKELSDVNSKVFRLLAKLSKLRNQNRWSTQFYSVECSVLGHLFDTACFAYLLGLDMFNEEAIATKMFFIGIFHDIPEAWTKDIPSPIKNQIDGFRTATEEYELYVLDTYFYSEVPEFMVPKLKAVMLEEPCNENLKNVMKTADYISASSECWRQYVGGTRDSYFRQAMRGNEKLFNANDGKFPITATFGEFHEYLLNYANALQFPDVDMFLGRRK